MNQLKKSQEGAEDFADSAFRSCSLEGLLRRGLALGLVIWGIVCLSGCGNEDSISAGTDKFIHHDSIQLDGESSAESFLSITSEVEGRSAVSVVNDGDLTLFNSTISKIGGERSGSPTYDKTGESAQSQRGVLTDNVQNAPSGNKPFNTPDLFEEHTQAGTPGSDTLSAPRTPGRVNPGAQGQQVTFPGPGATHAGVYAGNRGMVTLFNVAIETVTGEGKGLYASGEGSLIAMTSGTITTDGSTAQGVLATRKGEVYIRDVTIITKGEHSSAISTDQGGGTITISGGTFTAYGKYSAGIYSTGNITALNSLFEVMDDSAAVTEGGGKIALTNSSLWTGAEKGGVMLYQSFSGDTAKGESQFTMNGGSITADRGPLFYVTNTDAAIAIKEVKLSSATKVVLKALKGEWGTDVRWAKPTRGGKVTFRAEKQFLPGDLIADEFSTIDATFINGTTLKGAINSKNHRRNVSLTIDSSSVWVVTADSYVKGLTFSGGNAGSMILNIQGNGHTVYYDPQSCRALGGKTYSLAKGGSLKPI